MKHLITATLFICLAAPALAGFNGPSVTPPPQEIVDRFINDGSCDTIDNPDWENVWTGVELNANTRAHLIPCFLGAYNMVSKLILERRDDESDVSHFSVQHLAAYSSDRGWYARDQLVNASLDEKTGELSEFSKGRGIGDCGAHGRWEWTGFTFAMLEYAYEGECNGRLADEWPVIYQRTTDRSTPAPETTAAAEGCAQAPYCEDRRYFKDWLASCRPAAPDGGRFCSANAYVHNTDAPAGYDYQLRISQTRAGAPLRLSLIAVFEMMSRQDTVDIHVDGTRQILLAPDEIETPEAINDYFISSQTQTDFLIDAMRQGSEIRFDYTNEQGEPASASFSLSGLIASLLWIEEQAGNVAP